MMYVLMMATNMEMGRNFQTRSLPSIWHRCLSNIARMYLTLFLTIATGISQRKTQTVSTYQYLSVLVSSYLTTPAMDPQPIVFNYYPHYWEPTPWQWWAAHPELYPITPPRTERITPSRSLSHSLVGRAGLFREIGASYNHSAITSAWTENLSHQYSSEFRFRSKRDPTLVDAYTSMIYDEDTRSIIAAAKQLESSRIESSMSYLQ